MVEGDRFTLEMPCNRKMIVLKRTSQRAMENIDRFDFITEGYSRKALQ